MATLASGPPAAAAARRPAPPAPPSHASFILGQVRSGLAHLLAAKALDRSTYGQVDELLSKAVLLQHDDAGRMERGGEGETEEERLGKRNAWLRDTLRETSLLPTIVETAMNIAIPSAVMGDMQREAVLQLVERSQKAIAEAITNPNTQRRAQSGAWGSAKGAHSGIIRGWNAAGQSLQELSQKRQEARQRTEEKKAEKREKQALKKELKKEREAIMRQRQSDMLNEAGKGSSSSAGVSVANKSSISSGVGKGISSGSLNVKEGSDESDADPDNDSDLEEESDRADEDVQSQGGAVASVSCGRIDDEEGYTMATTTFSPWPGLLLSSTIVAISDDGVPSAKDIERVRFTQANSTSSQSNLPPPRRLAPPPLPSAADTDGVGEHRSSSTSQQPRVNETPSLRPAPQQTSASTIPPRREPREVFSPTASSSSTTPARYSQPLPAPPPQVLPSGESESARNSKLQQPAATSSSQSHEASLSRQPPSLEPSHPSTPSTQVHVPPRTEVRDVTDAKQKSWTRKLGL